MKLIKNLEFILFLIIITMILMSCARGTYYAPGEDYRYHKDRYYKDTYQTMNAAPPTTNNLGHHNNCHAEKRNDYYKRRKN